MLSQLNQLVWEIIKDGAKALLFWIVASLLMIHFLGQLGHVLSLGLGIIFIISFIIVTLRRVIFTFSSGMRYSGAPPPLPPNSGQLGGSTQPCASCGGMGRSNCYSCNGTGMRYDSSGGQQTMCYACGGLRTVACSACNGSGFVYV